MGTGPLSLRDPAFPALSIFPFAAAFLLMFYGADAWHLRLYDPDDYMRLAQIRAWLGGQAWWDVTQHQINPPKGVKLHWSRLADLPYAIPIKALSMIASPALAEKLVVMAVPLTLLLGALLAVARTAAHLAGFKAAMVSCFMLATTSIILIQYRPGRLDHHGLQLLLLILTVCKITGKDSFRSALTAGFCAAASIAVGLETAPYMAAIALWVAARWVVRGRPARASTLGFSAAVAISLPLLLLVLTPPSEWLLPTSDALGRGHALAALLGGGALALLVNKASAPSRPCRFAHCLIAGLTAGAVVVLFPEIVSAPYSEVDPLLEKLWLDNIVETRSIASLWLQSPPDAIEGILFIILSLVATSLLIRCSRGRERDMYGLFALLGVVGLVLTCWQSRAASLAHVVIIPPAAAAIAVLWRRWIEGKGVIAFAGALVVLNPALASAIPFAAQSLLRGQEKPLEGSRAGERARSCNVPSDALGLAALPDGLVVSPIDLSAMLLVRTPHAVYTSSNHRSYPQNRAAYTLFTAPVGRAQSLAAATGARYLVYCPAATEVRNLIDFAPHGLLAELVRGRRPKWLTPLREATRGGLHVFEIASLPTFQHNNSRAESKTTE